MSIYRIYAIIFRYAIVGFRELSRLMNLFYYPILDVILWGYMSLWMQQSAPATENVVLVYLSAMTLWAVVWAVQMEFTLNLHEELESRNVVNLFSTPITLSEWLIGNVILSALKSILVAFLSTVAARLLFGVNVLGLGVNLVPLLLLINCSGLVLGIFIAGILIRAGQRISTLIWSIPYLLLTFSAPFYPTDILPGWLQNIVKTLPMTHIFESLRHLIKYGTLPYKAVFVSAILNFIYLIGAIVFIFCMFNRSKMRGLAQLEQE